MRYSRTVEIEVCTLCGHQFNPGVEHTCVWDSRDIEIARHSLEKWLKEFEIYVEAAS